MTARTGAFSDMAIRASCLEANKVPSNRINTLYKNVNNSSNLGLVLRELARNSGRSYEQVSSEFANKMASQPSLKLRVKPIAKYKNAPTSLILPQQTGFLYEGFDDDGKTAGLTSQFKVNKIKSTITNQLTEYGDRYGLQTGRAGVEGYSQALGMSQVYATQEPIEPQHADYTQPEQPQLSHSQRMELNRPHNIRPIDFGNNKDTKQTTSASDSQYYRRRGEKFGILATDKNRVPLGQRQPEKSIYELMNQRRSGRPRN